jgi:hypothetical protein
VSDNDIYWIESIEHPSAMRVTSTGEEKIMFNGIPDWVYEGEYAMSSVSSVCTMYNMLYLKKLINNS